MRMYLVLSLLAFGLSSLSNGVSSDEPLPLGINRAPQNAAVVQGSNVTLNCSADNMTSPPRIMWAEFASNPVAGSIVSDGPLVLPGHPQAARFEIINDDPLQYDLFIMDTVIADGGRYYCQDVNDGPPSQYAAGGQLIILASEPTCTNTLPENGVILEGQNHTMECSVFYQGNISPMMTWSGPGTFRTGGVVNPDNLLQAVTFTVDRRIDTQVFSCQTNFSDVISVNNIEPGDATNSPDTSFTYISPQIFVQWGAKNTYAIPVKAVYDVADVLICYSDAFPPAIYQWTNMRTLLVISTTQQLVVDETFIAFTTTVRCTASNIIQGSLYSDNYFLDIAVPAPTTTTPAPPITTTTPPPAVAPCEDLTGRWQAVDPDAQLCLSVNVSNGRLIGLARNATDPFFIEINGRTLAGNYDTVGFNGLWFFNLVVSGFVGECHRCSGNDVLLVNALSRSQLLAPDCGVAFNIRLGGIYTFYRIGPACAGATFDVLRPTHISKELGIIVKDQS